MSDAWLFVVRGSAHAYELHAIGDRATVGGADEEIDLGVEYPLAIEVRDGAWWASGDMWLVDEVAVHGHCRLSHGQLLSHGLELNVRFLIGDRERVLAEERHLRTVVEPLTGLLLTRRTLFAQLPRLPRPTALLMIDLDRLKHVNDRLGHLAGDAVLRRTAAFLHGEVSWPDLAIRFGGEEFVVVLPDTSIERARRRAERIRVGLEPAMQIDGSIVNPTVSIGVAMLGDDPNDALRVAEENMIQAKEQGRNRVVG